MVFLLLNSTECYLFFLQLFQFREKEIKLKAGTEDLADVNAVGPSGDSSEVLPSSVSLRQIVTILEHFTSLCCLFFSIKICMFVKLLTEYTGIHLTGGLIFQTF